MLKGHTIIELTDVHTGEKEVVEHDNLITNAVQDILNALVPMYKIDEIREEFTPLCEKMMGGIFLFQEPLEESVDNTCLPQPSENPIVGYAGNGANDTTDTMRGSRNLTESVKLDNGYKLVWDFSTSQANGTISAVALTHADAGASPYEGDKCKYYPYYKCIEKVYSVYTNDAVFKLFQIVDFDFDKYIATILYSQSSTEILYIKYKFAVNEINMDYDFCELRNIQCETIDLSAYSDLIGDILFHWTDGGDGYYYGINIGNPNISIIRLSKNSLSFDNAFGKKTIQFSDYSDTYTSYYIKNKNYAVLNGYLYISNDKKNKIYKIKIADAAITDIIDGVSGEICAYKDVHAIITHKHYIFEDGTVKKRNENKTIIFDNNVNTSSYYSTNIINKNISASVICNYVNSSKTNIEYYLMIGFLKNYLATINNLPSPVTKTADKTMKITYTITESE